MLPMMDFVGLAVDVGSRALAGKGSGGSSYAIVYGFVDKVSRGCVLARGTLTKFSMGNLQKGKMSQVRHVGRLAKVGLGW